MPNYQNLRLKNIFDPNNPQNPYDPMQPNFGQTNVGATYTPTPEDYSQYQPDIAPLKPSFGATTVPPYQPEPEEPVGYQPQHTAADAYTKQLADYPVDAGHSKLGRIGAAIAGGATAFLNDTPSEGIKEGILMGHGLLDYKRNRQLADWKAKTPFIEKAADNERLDNTNSRQYANQTAENRRKQAADDAKDKYNTERIGVQTEALRLKQYKMDHPEAKFNFTGDEVIMTQNGVATKTGIRTRDLSPMQIIELNQDNAIKRIEAGTVGKIEAGHAALEDKKEFDEFHLPNQITLKQTVPGSSKVATPMTPAAQKVDKYNKAKQLVDTNPELGKYIHLMNNNDFEIDPITGPSFFNRFTGGMTEGPTQSQLDSINLAIHGFKPSGQPTGNTNPGNAVVPPEGRITVSNDGGKTKHTVPMRQLEKAKKQGYVPVQ